MAAETETKTAKASSSGMSSGKRFAIGINVIVQILILAFIFAAINFVSFRRFKRWDFSRDQKFALSSQTKSLLGGLQKPVKAIIYFSGAGATGQVAPDVSALLREYQYASRDKLTIEMVDPYRNLGRAKELAEKYRFAGEENIVILDYDNRSKFVNAGDMIEFDQTQQSPFMQAPQQVKAFKGEAAITSALLELVEGKPQKLYLTGGHGEADVRVSDRPNRPEEATIIADYFKRSNIKFDTVKLLDVERVPEDATALFIFGPKQDFSDREIDLLDAYWKNKGRILVLLNGNTKTPRLNAWLAMQGVKPGDGRLLRTVTMMNLVNGSRETRLQASGEGKFADASGAITKDYAGQNAFFFGPTTSLDLDKGKTTTDQIQFTELAEVNKDFWSELDGSTGPQIPSRDPAREREGPFTVAVALEKGAMEGVKVDTSRMIVVGNSGFLTDGGLTQFDVGLEFGLNSVNWLINREQGVGVGIPPKEKKLTALTLDEEKLSKLAYAVVFGLPLIVAFFGLISWLQRRR